MTGIPSGRDLFERHRQKDGGMGREAVRAILPYGDDFLFVDRVLRLDESSVEAVYTIPHDSVYVRSHFVDLPIMPGALVAEGMAQAGTLIVRYRQSDANDKDVIGLAIERARFLEPARPGETLTYRVRVLTFGSRAARLEGEAAVGDRRVGTARFVVGILDREALRRKLAGD